MEELKIRNILNEGWITFKEKFNLFLPIMLLFSFLPFMIPDIYQFMPFHIGFLTPDLIIFMLYIIVFFINIYFTFCIIFYFLKKQDLNFRQILKGGLNYYFKIISLFLIKTIILFPLYLLLLIPGLIFSFFWYFAEYFLIEEDTSFIESIKKSFFLVKGNWWRTFFFFFIIGLIQLFVYGVFVVVVVLINQTEPQMPLFLVSIFRIIRSILENLLLSIVSLLIIIFHVKYYEALKLKQESNNLKSTSRNKNLS